MNQIFERTIADLEKIHPDLLTGEGLSKLLFSCMGRSSKIKHDGWVSYKEVLFPGVYYGLIGVEPDPIIMELGQRFMADPTGWIDGNASDDVKKGAEWYQGLSSIFQGKNSGGMSQGMAEMFFYHSIRDNIQALQSRKGISSNKGKKTIGLLNGFTEVHDFCDQLNPIGEDAALMEQDARKVVDLFIVQMGQSTNYECFEHVGDECFEPISINEIGEYCHRRILEADLYTDCTKWVRHPNGGWASDGVTDHDPVKDPSEVNLYVQTEHELKSFQAVHVEKRFPWH